MQNKKNIIDFAKYNQLARSLFSQKLQEKREIGIHPDMNIGVFRAKYINEGMTISGVYVSSIVACPCSEFVVIKKDAFYKNIPSKDTIFAPGQKIRINNKDIKVEALINNVNISKLILPEIEAIHFLSIKKDYMYINNLETVCGNDIKSGDDDIKNNGDLFL